MTLDFEREFGVNAGYVEALHEAWSSDPASVDATWREIFERAAPAPPPAAALPSEPATAAPAAAPPAAAAPVEVPPDQDPELVPLTGIPGRIAANMTASLELPTATTVRTLPAKVLDENRRILNEHLLVRALGKASFTHVIAFALVRSLAEHPDAQAAFVERDGRAHKRVPTHVNLGLAIDVPGPLGRQLVVPNLKAAEQLDFRAFVAAYDDVVARGREGKLGAEDFQGTTVTLTNPGGFGTSMSVPRLMKGQGLIIATGAIGVPSEVAGASATALAGLAVGPVMTTTATYDHRVVQGAETGLLLKRLDGLLQGDDGFYNEIFRAFRVPWTPHVAEKDRRDEAEHLDAGELQSHVFDLIAAYRFRGCQIADLDPLGYAPDPLPSLDPRSYGFTVWDLDRTFLCDGMNGRERMTLREILAVLRRSYCRRWTSETMHVVDRERKHWIRARVENDEHQLEFTSEERRALLERVSRAENFERFLHSKYVGNKRFSLEGADSLIPTLAELIERAACRGVEKVVIGMAHRGRLNVLANILGKSYGQIFREFEGVLLPLSSEGSGDVKYHLGQVGSYTCENGNAVEVILSANPSHLEAVDPVVCGMTRAFQDALGDTERAKVLAILVHGDAAFSGQGVVPETLNMSQLRAYANGGTVHVVVNNQIGFTASPRDLRSTYYCTDVAKSVQAPIFHANGDYPESVLRAARLAVDYQGEFGEDSVVDMVCYRRWGHNEGDEPAYTQPLLYAKIRQHPTVRDHYMGLLVRRGQLGEDEADEIMKRHEDELRDALSSIQAEPPPELTPDETLDLADDDPADYADGPSPETGLPSERLVELVDRTNRVPEGHVPHPKLLRQLRRREEMVRGEKPLDWGCAEVLALGSLVEDGVPIRLVGQDSGRGTFSHRHAVIHDQATAAEHVPLAQLGAPFEVWDSLLSEEAAVAFEYGYSVARPEALVLWEAQFGDFANGAQIPIDQFVVSGEAKWKQHCGLVLLLPHGYDGQGPEHSSARPDRFLALCSHGNIVVANCSTSAQYFHLLRRQGRADPKHPLVVFTPKSLLRDKRASSGVEALASGAFAEVIGDDVVDTARVRRVVLSSGKVHHDLADYRAESGAEDVALVRLEQLYPFPRAALLAELARYGDATVVWCQEEVRNMGPWAFVLQRFVDLGRAVEYAGRPMAPSPATGSYRRHKFEQEHLVRRAFGVE